jgi:hypothetical protein
MRRELRDLSSNRRSRSLAWPAGQSRQDFKEERRLDRLPKEIAETSIKDWYDRLNRFKLPDLSAASASQS